MVGGEESVPDLHMEAHGSRSLSRSAIIARKAKIRMNRAWVCAWTAIACAGCLAARPCHAGAPQSCGRLVLNGDVSAGQEWSALIGQGWKFRLVPIPPLEAGYSGWDLVLDRIPPAGFPDALDLATPPYNSINEREIGTTYGLRAQDAIGWNPRSFRFLTDPAKFRLAQGIYDLAFVHRKDETSQREKGASEFLLKAAAGASRGELRILDAHISPGVADPAPFAQAWARASSLTPHQIDPSAGGKAAVRGTLNWMRFEVVLWLPPGWNLPPGDRTQAAACGQ